MQVPVLLAGTFLFSDALSEGASIVVLELGTEGGTGTMLAGVSRYERVPRASVLIFHYRFMHIVRDTQT